MKWCRLPFLLFCWMSCSVWAIQLNGNAYEFNIAISNQIKADENFNSTDLLLSIRDVMTQLSSLLFQTTDYRFYIGTVNILLPRAWTDIPGSTTTSKVTYANADMRVEETISDIDEQVITAARTKHSKTCGNSGEYIILPPQFFADAEATTAKYGDRVKVLLHEFAHFRYGVFEEYGYPDELYDDPQKKFPYYYINPKNEPQLTGCYDKRIEGEMVDAENKPCDVLFDTSNSCRFKPNMTATDGPATSIMAWQFLPTVNKFCDSSNHDRVARNKQNYWCRNRSVKSVMSLTADYTSTTPLNPNNNIVPTFRYLRPVPQTVYIVLDTSNHTSGTEEIFNNVKSALAAFVNNLSNSFGSSYVGVAGMSGSSTNFAYNRLGGYLAEAIPPVELSSNKITILNRISSLVRSSSGLLLEPALLDVGDNLSPFTHQSGSTVLLIKIGTSTGTPQTMKVETEVVNLLNSRNIQLVTVEIGTENVLERVTKLTSDGYFQATTANYQSQLNEAFQKVYEYLPNPHISKRVQLAQFSFATQNSSNSVNRYDGYTHLDWPGSLLDFNFFIPSTAASGITIRVQDPNNTIYNVPRDPILSWNGHAVYNLRVGNDQSRPTGSWRYSIRSSEASQVIGFVDIAEILPETTPMYIGGGGNSQRKPVEFEVYTSGKNGELLMTGPYEDKSLIIYVTTRKGNAYLNALQKAIAFIRRSSTGETESITLKDDGVYPDVLNQDGIFSGYYKPPADGIYNISIQMERLSTSLPPIPDSASVSGGNDPFSYTMSIDQNEFCCGSESTLIGVVAFFQRIIPYAASVIVSQVGFFTDRPTRIMDFAVSAVEGQNNDTVTFTWTAPANKYGSQEPVARYKLVYSTIPSYVIDDSTGLVPLGATELNATIDVESGSLIPLLPGSPQSVTVRFQRTPENLPPPLYFTISSIPKGSTFESFPAPMQFLPGLGEQPQPTTPTTTTTTTTQRPTTTTTATTTRPATTAPSMRATQPSTATTTTTTRQPFTPASGEKAVVSFAVVLLTFLLIFNH